MTAGDRQPAFTADENPLLSDSGAAWDHLIESVGPASLLVIIDRRMSAALKRRLAPEDIWQEALLHAWRDRRRCTWRGLRSFRSWLLTIIDHRIRDAAIYEGAAKRGGPNPAVPFSALERFGSRGSTASGFPGPVQSTTPSRIAIYKEQASAMQAALESLPPDVRDVVRLRLFEQLTMEQIADRLDVGISAARHRFTKGAQIYQRRLMSELASRSQTMSEKTMRNLPDDSSSTK